MVSVLSLGLEGHRSGSGAGCCVPLSSWPQGRSTNSRGYHEFSQSSKPHPVCWHQPHRCEVPDPRNAAPNSCLLAAVRETGILPKVEMKEWECEIKELTSPPLPLALLNSRETLRDLKAWRLMGMLSRSRRRAAGRKAPASPIHPAAYLGCGQSTEAVGKHHPSWAG